jgi:hypothetical protein
MNTIGTEVRSFIRGGAGIESLSASSIDLDALDSAKLDAFAGAAAVSGGFALGKDASSSTSICIGVAVAHNQINNIVSASIEDLDGGLDYDLVVELEKDGLVGEF